MRQSERITKKILFNITNNECKTTLEASAMLENAQSLMIDYELPPGRQEPIKLQVMEVGTEPLQYLFSLASLIATVFCCKAVAYRGWRGRYFTRLVFVGINPATTVALRAFERISVQLVLSRLYFISTLPAVVRGGLPAIESLGDEWANAWVADLDSMLTACTPEPDHLALIDDWLNIGLPSVMSGGCVIKFGGSPEVDPDLICPPVPINPCACTDVNYRL